MAGWTQYPIQTAALDTLVEQNIFSPERWRFNEVSSSEGTIAPELVQRLYVRKTQEDEELEAFLRVLATEYPLTGVDGLKDRTQLLEHRHDAA